MEWLARDKHSSLFGPFVNYEVNMTPGLQHKRRCTFPYPTI